MNQNSEHKLGVIVPYRNRYRQLLYFKKAIVEYLKKERIKYELIVVEQDDGTSFNRAKLLNIGYLEAVKLGCDYVVFHDVDMLPLEVDYSYRNVPTHLATNFIAGDKEFGLHFEQYFGGVTMFPVNLFAEINGYSNEYWGWGFEDDDLFSRVQRYNLPVDNIIEERPYSSTANLKFNGISSYVRIPNKINFSRDWSISLTFTPEEIDLDHEADFDRNVIFTIPGYDFSLCYNSFNRYVVEIFDRRRNSHTISTDIKRLNTCNATITWNNTLKLLKFYINGELIGSKELDKGVFNYTKENIIFLGCSNPALDAYYKPTFYKGTLEYFASYSKVLTDEEIVELHKTQGLGLLTDFGSYASSGELTSYFDAKVIKHYRLVDLIDFIPSGELFDIQVIPCNLSTYHEIKVPFRVTSTFKLLDHKPGGYQDGRWKDKLTRFNQLKFTNEAEPGFRDPQEDGLNTLEFITHSSTNHKNETHIVVGL